MSNHLPSPTRIVLLAASVLMFAACGAATPTPTASASGDITAALTEFKIELGAASAAAGPVTFSVKNDGTIVHQFVVMKTDLAADALPLTSDGLVDQEGVGITQVDEIEDIAVGATMPLTVTLASGHYLLICNLPGHYAGGMRVEFTATP